jgi:hypothetical protein
LEAVDYHVEEIGAMNKPEANTPIVPGSVAELQEALNRLAQGVRDTEAARRSRERMDRMREENRKRFGVQNVGVDIIREMRDSR